MDRWHSVHRLNNRLLTVSYEYMSSDSHIDGRLTELCETECVCPELVLPLLGRVAPRDEADSIAEMFALLADATRLRLLHALSLSAELCVCDLAFLIEASQSAVSHQLRALRTAGVVTRRKEGRTSFYALDDDRLTELLREQMASHIRIEGSA